MNQNIYESLEESLGYTFSNKALLLQALTHKSFVKDSANDESLDNERLEFLGDSVLDLVLSEYLMEILPEDSEGDLSKRRAVMVSEEGLLEVADILSVAEFIRLGKGELSNGGLEKPRLLSSAVEALIGALYLDAEYSICRSVIRSLFSELVMDSDAIRDFKSQLQGLTHKTHNLTPNYRLDKSRGLDHEKIFEVSVWLDEKKLAVGTGSSKKRAEQEAAKFAIEGLGGVDGKQL